MTTSSNVVDLREWKQKRGTLVPVLNAERSLDAGFTEPEGKRDNPASMFLSASARERTVLRELFEVALRMEGGFSYECGGMRIAAFRGSLDQLRVTSPMGQRIHVQRHEVKSLIKRLSALDPWQGIGTYAQR